MHSAASDREDQPPPRDLHAETAALISRAGAALEWLMSAPASADAINETAIVGIRLTELAAVLAERTASEYAAAAFYARGLADGEARAAATAARVPGARHARQGRILSLVRGLLPVGALTAALKPLGAAAGHPGAAHSALKAAVAAVKLHPLVTAAGAVTAAVPVALAATVVTGSTAHTAQYVTSTAPGAATSGAQAAAAPVVSVSPAARVRPKADARSARKVPVPALAPVPYASPSASASASLSPSSLPAFLTAVPSQLDLAARLAGQITLTATGGAVQWSASCDNPDVTLSFVPGTLRPGDQAYIRVSVAPGTSGSATVTIQPGGIQVPVTWLLGLPVALPSSLGL